MTGETIAGAALTPAGWVRFGIAAGPMLTNAAGRLAAVFIEGRRVA